MYTYTRSEKNVILKEKDMKKNEKVEKIRHQLKYQPIMQNLWNNFFFIAPTL